MNLASKIETRFLVRVTDLDVSKENVEYYVICDTINSRRIAQK